MKNLKLYELVIVAIISILICLEFVIIGREIIGISGDFITAGTTLFASFVAYMIFTDWREQHRVDMLKEIREKLHILFNKCENKFDEFHIEVGKVINGATLDMKKIAMTSQEMANYFELLIPEIDFLIKVLKEFDATLENKECKLDEIENVLVTLIYDLSEGQNECDTTTVGNYWVILERAKVNNFLNYKKTIINEDLQKLILKFYKNN